jgi:ABC-2 type transport system permease protein
MIKALFKASFRTNRGLLLTSFLIVLMYQTIIINMFDPENAEAMTGMIQLMPEAVMAAFGFKAAATDLTTHVANFLYGFVFLVFPLIYVIPAGFRMIGKHVDCGSMVYLLATPHTRKRIALTQTIFLLTTTTILLAGAVLMGILFCESVFPGMLRIGDYLLLNLVTLGVFYVISGIVFFVSCLFNDAGRILGAAIGIPATFFVFKMLYSAGEELAFFKYLTIYSLTDPKLVFSGTGKALLITAILFAATALIYAAAIRVFDKRSLVI